MISILHPSRQRAKKSFGNLMKWILSADEKFELIISLDNDDPEVPLYKALYMNAKATIIENDNRSAVDAINNAAKVSSGDILMVVSDDTDCDTGWDTKLKSAVVNKKDWIAKTPDGIQSWLITAPIMDREYYNRFGYIYHPEYLHMFCDTELSCVADLTARRINLPITFKHNHYSVSKTEKDVVSIKADNTWTQGEETFLRRLKKKFDLKETPGKITDAQYINWAKSKGVII